MWVTSDAVHYLPVLVLLIIAATIGGAMMGINALVGAKGNPKNRAKYEVYECGVPTVGTGRQQFSVRYYLVGIVFLLFDVEVVFMYPWAVVYRRFLSQGAFILIEMAIFLAILLVGYLYLLRRKGLSWD